MIRVNMKNRIYLYPYAGPRGKNYINQKGTIDDICKLGINLKDGLMLHFYCDDGDDQGKRDDLIFEGRVYYDRTKKEWYVYIDSSTYRHRSEKTSIGDRPG